MELSTQDMNTIIKPFPKQQKQKKIKIDSFPNAYNIYNDIIVAQQSLPISQFQYYFPFVDVSKRFEESIEKCRKKPQKRHMKIKAIENIQIPKTLSEKLIQNYRKSQDDIKNDGKTHRNRCTSETTSLASVNNNRRASELVDQLLLEIYGRSSTPRAFETEYCSSTSFKSATDKFNDRLQYSRLVTKDITELEILITALKDRVKYTGNLLVKHLKKREALNSKQEKICNVITATLQAHSGKKCEDTNMRFSPSPVPGDSGFNQWRDAMKMVAKLPGGIPAEFRRKLWLALAEKHLQSKAVNWNHTEKLCFNEWSNPDDSELGVQIVKDLHRTGCSLFCGAAGQENQALLKRVLLAYARWNKSVGYCQGFNMLAALILQVMDKNETDSVKVMIYLIEGVLPESYFANNLRGLSVDMIVFRDLLKLRLPVLSKHLEVLQNDAREGNSYEPPLTNVFTMQWFLTLFCNCLPQPTVLRVWDLIFLEGNEILLRTAIAIWQKLSDRILAVNSADEFYSIMGVLTREMLEFGLVDSNTLIKSIVDIGPCPELNEMRDRYLYNITPWTQSVSSAAKKGFKLFYSDDDEQESDYDEKAAVTAAYGISVGRRRDKSSSLGNIIQPYAHGHPDRERLALDISALKKQYSKLRERQRQAHIILQAACARQPLGQNSSSSPIAMNHLLLGKNAILNSRGRRLGPPKGAIPPVRTKPPLKKMQSKEGETILWKDTAKVRFPRRQSLPEACITPQEPPPLPEESDSSSYSDDDASSTSTELCDDPGRMSDFESDDKTNELPKDKTDKKETQYTKKTETEFKEIVAEIDTLKLVDTCKPEEVKHKFERQSTIEDKLISKLEYIEEDSDVTHIKEETTSSISPIANYDIKSSILLPSENFLGKSSMQTPDDQTVLENEDPIEFSNLQQFISPIESQTNQVSNLIDMDSKEVVSPSSKNDTTLLQFLSPDDSPNITRFLDYTDNKTLAHPSLVKIPSVDLNLTLPESKINEESETIQEKIEATDLFSETISEQSNPTNLIILNDFESNNIIVNDTDYDSNIEFESFLEERIKISKENSIESIKSPKEESNNCKTSEEKFRRHKSYEETSTSSQIEKTQLFKQKSFDINNLPIIETTIWKPYGIEEESPKEEIINVIIEETSDKPSVIKQTSVDLLTVEDKRFESGRRNSERALKIIQENSLILHRILLQQKSSEKEDSEDELSKSPISKTFLRSESLLSKDEKTDEERSSKDGEEEFIESGVESFSVSPALIEEEIIDVIHEEITSTEDAIFPKTDLECYSPNKDLENNSVQEFSKNYEGVFDSTLDPAKSKIFEENTVKITEICKSNNINIATNYENLQEFPSIYTEAAATMAIEIPGIEEIKNSSQNDSFNLSQRTTENLNTLRQINEPLLKFEEVTIKLKDIQNYEDILEDKIYETNISKTENYGNKSEYLMSPIEINTLKSSTINEDAYYNLQKCTTSSILQNEDIVFTKEDKISNLDEIVNKSEDNINKDKTETEANLCVNTASYTSWQPSKDEDETLDYKKVDEGDYLPCYKYKNEETKIKDNSFSPYDTEDIEKPKSFYEGKYYTEYIDKLKEDKYNYEEISPLQPSKHITSTFLPTETIKSSNIDEKTTYLTLESPSTAFSSIKNKYSDFSLDANISNDYKDDSYQKYEKEDTFSYSESPRKTYLSDDSYSVIKKEDYSFDKKSIYTKSIIDDDPIIKKDKTYLKLESPDDYTIYKDKKNSFELKSKYSYDFDDKLSKNSSYSSTIELSKYNEDKSDNNSSNNSFSFTQSHFKASPDSIDEPEYKQKHLSIDLKPAKTREYSPEVSPPKHLSCLQFTTFQADIPCTSKAIQLSPICNKEKSTSPSNSSPTKTPKYLYSFNLPTLSPPRRTTKSPLSPDKCFSPFPVQPTTRQPKELGVRLGLYKDISPLKSPSK